MSGWAELETVDATNETVGINFQPASPSWIARAEEHVRGGKGGIELEVGRRIGDDVGDVKPIEQVEGSLERVTEIARAAELNPV